jgi:hypothetical protein
MRNGFFEKENFRQDYQDSSDRRAFGLGAPRRRRKKSHYSCKSCPKKKISIESIQHSVPLRKKNIMAIRFL